MIINENVYEKRHMYCIQMPDILLVKMDIHDMLFEGKSILSP